MRHPLAVLVPALASVLVLALPAHGAQEPARRVVEAFVTSVAGEGVYLDRGREDRIEPGDEVRLQPVSGPRVLAVVEAVSRSGSRVRVPAPEGIAVGDRAEVLVPEQRFAPPAPEQDPPPEAPEPVPVPTGQAQLADGGRAAAARPPVAHPPWTAPPPEWDLETPLLAPPASSAPADRESRIDGRVYLGFDHTEDGAGGEDRSYSLARLGFDARQENPFGHGGELELDLELFGRSADTGGEDDDETVLRLDRLSYAVGGTREAPRRLEVGRFLQDAFPEFGLLDGVELQQRIGAGRLGLSLGAMPVHDERFDSDDDLQAAVFYRRDAGEGRELDWGLGYQKSWHDGASDRDLVVADAGWRPNDRSWYWGTVFLDHYTDGDVKSGLELTELRAGARWTLGEASGLSIDVARVRWPDLERWEYTPITVAELEDTEVTRVGLGGWYRPGEALRLSGRVTRWEDEDGDGGGGELRADWYEPFWDDGRASLTAYTNEAAFGDVLGVRLEGTRSFSRGQLLLGWEVAEHEQQGFAGEQETLLQHALRGAWDMRLGEDWDLSLSLDQRFGDEQDATSLGFFLQRRF